MHTNGSFRNYAGGLINVKNKIFWKDKKDLKTCQKRNYDFALLEEIIIKLQIPEQLDEKNKDHNLSGDYSGFRKCNILPD